MQKNTVTVGLGLVGILALAASVAHATDGALDRNALLKLADTYLAALVAHDPRRVPLGGSVKVVENVTRIKPGEGLWKTAGSAPTAFKIVAADPVTQEVGALVVMQNEGKLSQVGFRLRLMNGKII